MWDCAVAGPAQLRLRRGRAASGARGWGVVSYVEVDAHGLNFLPRFYGRLTLGHQLRCPSNQRRCQSNQRRACAWLPACARGRSAAARVVRRTACGVVCERASARARGTAATRARGGGAGAIGCGAIVISGARARWRRPAGAVGRPTACVVRRAAGGAACERVSAAESETEAVRGSLWLDGGS